MQQEHILTWLALFMIVARCADGFELFIWKTNEASGNASNELLTPFLNQSYQLPLFQRHYVTVRALPSDSRNKSDNRNVVGYNIQVRSTKAPVVSIEKVQSTSVTPAVRNKVDSILLNDLYIVRRKHALGHIFNAYPSPALIRLNRTSMNNATIESTWSIEGTSMDITNVTFHLNVFYDDNSAARDVRSLNILVTQPKRRVDTAFYVILPVVVIGISILMGILLDPTVIGEIIKKPKAVLIGFLAQYGLMPFLAMAIAKIFHYTPLNSLALFIIGCCPGSGASNQWTVIFDGDVNLSAVMSFVSTASSFVMMPLYLYTLGTLYTNELAIKVPFWGLARSLALVVVPYSLGILISHFAPHSRLLVKKLIKPMMICLMVFFLTFGMFVNWYMFKMIDLYTTLTAPLLPFLGFFLGAGLAWMSRLSWTQVKTIGIEAGIQNTGIAFMIILYSFPQPYATQAIIVPMVVSLLTTKPFWVLLIIQNKIRKYQKNKQLKKTSTTDEMIVITNGKSPNSDDEKDDEAQKLQQL